MKNEQQKLKKRLLTEEISQFNNAELLALVLTNGGKTSTALDLANKLLDYTQGSLTNLFATERHKLLEFSFLSETKICTLLASFELGKRKRLSEAAPPIKISSAYDAFVAMHEYLYDEKVEYIYVILLNRANHILSIEKISMGGVAGTIADPKTIFKAALSRLASGMILVHNHPSGNKQPSQQDIALTNKLKKASHLLDIQFLDHIIYTNHGFYSFSEERQL